ncbi:MAG: hypothetical protein NTX03_11790 [Bacteroidetes bacterium]|nr:hypothetical protein [Bacteroidota bacterium]
MIIKTPIPKVGNLCPDGASAFLEESCCAIEIVDFLQEVSSRMTVGGCCFFLFKTPKSPKGDFCPEEVAWLGEVSPEVSGLGVGVSGLAISPKKYFYYMQ